MFFSRSAVWLHVALCACLAFASSDMSNAVSEMQTKLSKDALVVFPNSPLWPDLQIRGSSPRISPNYTVVAEVATESDVSTVVSIANHYDIPFLAVSGTHGWTKTLEKLPYGIQIDMRKMNTTTLNPGGNTAIVGGGTLQYEITRSLYALGKYAVTGLAECVSLAGPLLGGGHSLLQGQYGYSVDGLVSARVVLGNGQVVTASKTENSDLFWGLQGAGHNFGILTSLEVKTYDIPSNWTVYSLIYTTDKLEALFGLLNYFEDPATDRPTKLALTGVFVKIPTIDPNNPVIAYTVAYEGSQQDADPYANEFKALGPVSTTITTDVNYVALYTVTGNNLGSQACITDNNILGAGTSFPRWDLPSMRKAFTLFGNITADSRFTTAITLLENYGTKGVKAINPASTSLAPQERINNVLASPVLWWTGNDPQTTKDAYAYVDSMRDAMYTALDASGGKRHCYVNYANGDEPLPQMYGYGDRVNKLKALKQKWDPNNQFRFYNPLN